MKIVPTALVLVAASLLYSTAVLSGEKAMGLPDGYGQNNSYESNVHKNQCLIMAQNCIGSDDTVIMRVKRLNREIQKGTSVYTPEELKSFQEQLIWIYNDSEELPVITM